MATQYTPGPSLAELHDMNACEVALRRECFEALRAHPAWPVRRALLQRIGRSKESSDSLRAAIAKVEGR